MDTRLMWVSCALPFVLFVASCQTPHGVHQAQMMAVAVAQEEVEVRVQVTGMVLEQNVTYTFHTPLVLSVRHQAPHNANEVSEFNALAAPLAPGQAYQLRFRNGQRPLLTVSDGILYAGSQQYPAIGGKIVGTHGGGTIVMVEARDDVDYVYLLQGGYARQFNLATPGQERQRIVDTGRVARYTTDPAEDADPEPIAGARAEVRDRMVRLAGKAGLASPDAQ